MKIVKLQAENFKGLKAVEISPDGDVVIVSGANGAGKTSVLDAIWQALGGASAAKSTTKPIREGQTRAEVKLDLGDLVVTRTWTGTNSKLTVINKDGASYGSPQKMLDSLVGRLSFDPLAFAQLDAKAQLAQLLELVDLPFNPDELAARRKDVYDERTTVGRAGKSLAAQLDALPAPSPDLPAAELSASELFSRLRTANLRIENNAADRRQLEGLRAETVRAEQAAREIAQQLTAAVHYRDELQARLAQGIEDLADIVDPDTTQLELQLAQIEDINRAVRASAQRAELAKQVEAHRNVYMQLSEQIESMDEAKAVALRAAAMPVDGLGFDDDGVTYQGVPFAQASAAERLRVSVAMAMALNPSIRVIRITDASLLDSGNLQLIRGMAGERDFQVWLEVVDETGQVGVVIEDGAIAAVNPS